MAIRTDNQNDYEEARFEAPVQPPFTRHLRPESVPGAYRADLYTLKPELANQTPDLESFHVFTWISTVQDRQNASKAESSSEEPKENLTNTMNIYILDVNRYKKAKSEVGAFLDTKLNPQETNVLRNSIEKSVTDVSVIHETLVQGFEEKNVNQMYNRSSKTEFAWAAKVVLAFFFPLQTDDAIVRKYWGGVHAILSFPVSKLDCYTTVINLLMLSRTSLHLYPRN